MLTHQYEMQFLQGVWTYIKRCVSPKFTVDAKIPEGEQKGTLEELKKIYGDQPDWFLFVFDNDLTAPSTIMQTFWKLEAGESKEDVREKLSKKNYMIGSPLTHVEWVDQLSPKEIRQLTTDELDAEDELEFEQKEKECQQSFEEFMQLSEEDQLIRARNCLSKLLEDLNSIETNTEEVII
jgi:hypothetical protein